MTPVEWAQFPEEARLESDGRCYTWVHEVTVTTDGVVHGDRTLCPVELVEPGLENHDEPGTPPVRRACRDCGARYRFASRDRLSEFCLVCDAWLRLDELPWTEVDGELALRSECAQCGSWYQLYATVAGPVHCLCCGHRLLAGGAHGVLSRESFPHTC